MKQPDQILSDIALKHLFIETLATRKNDGLNFHEVAVWCVQDALAAAYEAGLCTVLGQPETVQKQLTSSGLFHTPGLFRAWQHDYRCGGKARQQAVKALSEGYGLSREEAVGLLSGAIASEIDDEAGTVTFASRRAEPSIRVAVAAPRLLAACRLVAERWERGDLAEAVRLCDALVTELKSE